MGMRNSLIHMLLCVATQTWATRLKHRELSDYPLALCNDGTFASYFYSEDDLANPYLLIDLQGGGSCQSPESCQDRCETDKPSFCTSDTAPYHYMNTTMWSQDPEENPPFHNFGKVFVHYCSSDVYSGTRDKSADTNGYSFHGKHIIEALVEDIIKHKPTIENMEQLVFMGTSAGAFGVALNCDYVAEQFHGVVEDLDVRCIADGGDFYPPWVHQDGCDPYNIMSQVSEFWEGVGDQSCLDSSPEGSRECIIFPSYYNFIETPFMVVNHYIDTTVHGPCTPPVNQNQEFWEYWEQQVYAMALSFMEDKPKNGLFLSNCPFHVSVSQEFAWGQMDVPLVNAEGSELYKNVVRNWLTGEGPYQAMDMPLEKNPKCPY
eukprot:GFUD01000837.1.p1 GENE.GFUD01000837.1~~GFUD01000837.1.p1  ORF type:complete len:375 (+),score=79.15 GFUD01000837.1:235-1359(+)